MSLISVIQFIIHKRVSSSIQFRHWDCEEEKSFVADGEIEFRDFSRTF